MPNRRQILDAIQNAHTTNEGFFHKTFTLDGSKQKLSFPESVEEGLLSTNVVVSADLSNANPVKVGNKELTDTNFLVELSAGDSVQIKVDNPNVIYVIGTESEKITCGGELFRWLR